MNRILTEIKKPRRANSQADNKVLIYAQRFQNSKKMDISELKSSKYVIFDYDKSQILISQIKKCDISIFLVVCSGSACFSGGVQKCAMRAKLVM